MRVVGGRIEREAKSLSPGLGQQCLRALGIVGVDGGQILVPRVRRRNHRSDQLTRVAPDGLEELLAVDGRVDGLAHARVIEGGLRVVEGEQFLRRRGALGDHEVGVALEGGQRIRGLQGRDDVDVARAQGVRHRGGVRVVVEGDRVVLGGVAPVAVAGLERQGRALRPRIQRVGAGAVGLGLRVEALGNHPQVGQVVGQGDQALRERHGQRLGICGLDRVDDSQLRLARGLGVLGQDAVDRMHGVGCIEGRAVGEGHAITQVEGVGQAILAHVVGGGQLGLNRAVVGEGKQTLVDITVERLGDALAATCDVGEVDGFVE